MINFAQDSLVLIGTRNMTIGTTTGNTLTAAYQSESSSTPTKSFKTGGYNRVVFYAKYVMGATETANNLDLRVEVSPDNINWYRIANDSTSGATSTLTAREFTFVGADAATATISIILDIGYEYMRVSAKESGVVTNFGNVFVEGTFTSN